MTKPIIKVCSLKKSFGVFPNKVVAVDSVSFEIKEGTTLGLVGQSGCGKSTIGKMLVGLYPPDDGNILFRGIDLTRLSKKEKQKISPKIQMIFQSPYASLNPALPIKESLLDAVHYHKKKDQDFIESLTLTNLLEMVELPESVLGRYPHELSGGQCQRIGIARALSLEPEVLICDEITSALDMTTQAQITNLLLELQQQLSLTILFISHDIGLVRHMSDNIAVMCNGIIEEIGPADQIFSHPSHPSTRLLLNASFLTF